MTAVGQSGTRRPVVAPSAVFWALVRRDVRVARREIAYFLVRTVMQPVLFIIVFGYLLPKMGFVGPGYTTALVPGVLVMSLLVDRFARAAREPSPGTIAGSFALLTLLVLVGFWLKRRLVATADNRRG